MASSLKLSRDGAVGFIDWLDSGLGCSLVAEKRNRWVQTGLKAARVTCKTVLAVVRRRYRNQKLVFGIDGFLHKAALPLIGIFRARLTRILHLQHNYLTRSRRNFSAFNYGIIPSNLLA